MKLQIIVSSFILFFLYRITTFMELRFCILYTFQNTLKTRDK